MESFFREGQEAVLDGSAVRILKCDPDGDNFRVQHLSDGKTTWCKRWQLDGGAQHIIDSHLAALKIYLRTKDPTQVQAWREMFVDEDSEALRDLDEAERGQVRDAFVIEEADIFESFGTLAVDRSSDTFYEDAGACAVVSPANSFGDMTGGIDLLYLQRFGTDLQKQLQSRIQQEHDGELIVGNALLLETLDDRVQYCISAPTMRVPRDIRGTCNVYLCFRAALIAVKKHNAKAAVLAMHERTSKPIVILLCPGLGTGIGLLPAGTCAFQMIMAYRQQVLGRKGCFESASLDHSDLVKSR